MAKLIPSYTITDFKKLKVPELKRLKSCELTSDGHYVCTVIIPQTDYIRVQTENLGMIGNAVKGESLEDILNKEAVSAS